MLYGTSYYPLHYQKSDFEADFIKMQQLGFNCIRTAELICAWDWLEKEENKIDFTSIDIVFEFAKKYQMKVILGTGSASPPAWLLKKYDDIRIKDRDGIEYPLNGMWAGASIFHPEFINAHQRYLKKLIERYQDNHCLYGWQIHNEAGYPFVHKIGQSRSFFDYSKFAIQSFQNWLQKKYQDTDDLFEAWRWTPSNQRYSHFYDVEAPILTASEWGSPMAWQDWILFHQEGWTDFIFQQQKLIQQEQHHHHPTIINFYGKGIDWDASGCIDPYAISEKVDIVGYDIYPWLYKFSESKQQSTLITQLLLDFYASISQYLNKPLFLPEVESGPIGGFFQGPENNTTQFDILRYFALSLARSTACFLFQAYREWEALPLHWGALVDFNNQATERFDAAKKIGQIIHQYPTLQNAKPIKNQIEILYDYNNIIAFSNTNETEALKHAIINLYQTLTNAGYQVGFINIQQILKTQAQCLILPRFLYVSPDLKLKLDQLNQKQVSIIAFAKTGYVNQFFKRYRTQPGAEFDQLFGIQEIQIEKRKTNQLIDKNKTIQIAEHLLHTVKLMKNTAKVVSRFADQTPASIHSKNNETTNLYFCFDADSLIHEQNQPLQQYFIEQLKQGCHLEPYYPNSQQIEIRILKYEKQYFLILVNKILGKCNLNTVSLTLPKACKGKPIQQKIIFDEGCFCEIERDQIQIKNLKSALILYF